MKRRKLLCTLCCLSGFWGVTGLSHSAPATTSSAPGGAVNELPDSDIQTIKARLLASFFPLPSEIEALVTDVQSAMKQQKADGSWPDIDYTDTSNAWPASNHLKRLREMVQVLRVPKSPLFNSPQLEEQSLRALRFWLQHDYTNANWWHNEINVPRRVGEIALLLEDELTPRDRDGIDKILDRASITKAKPSVNTGANLVWRANTEIMRGVLDANPQGITAGFRAIWDEVKVVETDAGIQTDWSFHQHGPLLYSGAYGNSFLSTTARYAKLARGTRFTIPLDKEQILESYLLDGQAWMIRGGFWDLGVRGRAITKPDGERAEGVSATAENLASLAGPRRSELVALTNRLRQKGNTPDFTGNRYFYKSDFMTHHRAGYYTSVRMFSTRTYNTDSFINGENKKTHHIADGANLILRRGDEYEGIYPVWDWRKIPGTTVEQNSIPLNPKRVRSYGETSFVGGVSDGIYGVSAMHLQRDALTARKAWFFFDDAYVCLGAGIHDTSSNEVATTVNQCLLNGEVTTPRGKMMGNVDLSGFPWVRHDGVTYLFPTPMNLRATIGPQTGKWSDIGPGSNQPVAKNVFNLWIEHGKQPLEGSYAYIVRPADTAPPTPEAATNIKILSNTPDLQAVQHTGLKIMGVVFIKPGQITFEGTTLQVDQPCLLLSQQTPQGFAVSVSNPENKKLQVHVVVKHNDTRFQANFDLPEGTRAGSTVTQTLK